MDQATEFDSAVSAYLGTDIADIVKASEFFADPVLTALVPAPVAKRKEELEKFKARRIGSFIQSDPVVREGFRLLDAVVQAEAITGKTPLGELAEMATTAYRAAEVAVATRRRKGLADLKAHLVALHEEPDSARSRPVPACLVMLQDGRLRAFAKYSVAKTWARQQGMAWVSFQVDRETARFDTNEALDDAPGIEAAAGAAESDPKEPEPVKAVVGDSGELLPV